MRFHTNNFVKAAVALVATGVLCAAQARSQPYVVVSLPQNVLIELPRNWVAFSNNQRITLDAAATARLANADIVDFRSELAFAANYFDDGGRTAGIANVRYYPQQIVTQADSRNASAVEVQELDLQLQQELQKGVSLSGNRLLAWFGTSKRTVNGLVTFVSEYRRSSPNGSFQVRLVRVLDAGRSFTLTVSYREDQAYFLAPISDYITRSLRR